MGRGLSLGGVERFLMEERFESKEERIQRVCEYLEDIEIGDMAVFEEKGSMFGSIADEGVLDG